MSPHDVPFKANRVLHFIILFFLLILVRIWYLCVIERDAYVNISKKTQKKTYWHPPLRGTIRDRFNIPLAINVIRYDAAICYDKIRQIPSVERSKNQRGELVKRYPRKEYIQKLSAFLAKELQLDAIDIQDTLYGQAALFPRLPFTLKENISESLYYYLRGLERLYPGLCTLTTPIRYYPQHKVGADVIGYVGSLGEKNYLSISAQIKELENYLKDQAENNLVFLPKGFTNLEHIREHIKILKAKIRHPNEKTGLTGIEAKFHPHLKGEYGKERVEIDTQGSIVRKLPGSKPPHSGNRLLLNISSELQEFAEALLAENEEVRERKFSHLGKNHHLVTPPWMKGGAIVAMIPTTGEIVALASYPRIEGNDFITSSPQVFRWLESKSHIADLWDGKAFLEREFYSFKAHHFYKEEKKLSWEAYLERVLSLEGSTKKSLHKVGSLHSAIELQKSLDLLLDLSEQPYITSLIDALYPPSRFHKLSVFATPPSQIKQIQDALSQHELCVKDTKILLDKIFAEVPYNDDKLLIIDIIRLVAPAFLFNEELLPVVGTDTLSNYRKLSQAFSMLKAEIRNIAKKHFHLHDFRTWRTLHFKEYLSKKRLEEKEKKLHSKPFIEYLKKMEAGLFDTFWNSYQWDLIQLFFATSASSLLEKDSHLLPYFESFRLQKNSWSQEKNISHNLLAATDLLTRRVESLGGFLGLSYLKTMRSFNDLQDKLYGYYPQIKKKKGFQTQQDLAAAFYPPEGYGYGRSYAFRQSTPLGSIFKIITAYEALRQNYEKMPLTSRDNLNPLTIIDEIQPSKNSHDELVLGFHEDGKKITRYYKGGILPRTHAPLGKIDYIKAFERSSNVYFSLLASDVIQDPNDLSLASLKFGFGNKTGIDLPGEIPGVLPTDLNDNRSGLYAFAIGHHSLIATPLQTAVMLSSLVNEGEVLKPQILHLLANTEEESFSDSFYAYQDYLNRVGIFFPFFIGMEKKEKKHSLHLFEKTLHRKLFLPDNIKEYLLEGLHSVVSSPNGSARAELIRYLYNNTSAMRNYLKLRYQLAGKTSSAEVAYRPTLDRECPLILRKDIWFGGCAFQPQEECLTKKPKNVPELVVVVYLKFGDFGKEAAPLAGEIVTKWREICKRHLVL